MSPKRASSVDVIRAGGGAVWRPVDGRGKKSTGKKAAKRAVGRAAPSPIEILLVHRPRYDDWSLPKGKADAGEGWKACARREVLEETGMRVRLGPRLRKVHYRDRHDRPKEVRFYAMSDPKGTFRPNDEVDEVRWLSPEAAIELATRGSDVDVIKDLMGHLSDPSVPSTWWRVPNDPGAFFSAHELDRAGRYQKPLSRLRLAGLALSVAVGLIVIFGELAPRLVDALGVTNWVLQLVVIVCVLELLSLVLSVPPDAWIELGHDKRWDLSTQTTGGFITDQAKGLALGLVVNVILLVPLYAIIRSTDLWWVWCWLLVVVFSIGLGFLYPVVIAPIFNTFTPLDEDDPVAGRVQSVAAKAGVSISGTFVADESRRSRRDNAYVAGLGATRRVVLFDTLLEHPPEIVEQVVAHEVGHWRLKHLRRQIPVAAALMFVVFAGLAALAEWDWLFAQAGVTTSGDIPLIGQPTALPILMAGVQVGFGVVGLLTAWVSRAFERQADLEALELLGEPDVMLDMQRRLHTKNLADLEPGRLKRLQGTHPPAAERMAFTTRWAETETTPAAS